MTTRGHPLRLLLSTSLEMALIRLQGKKCLGRSFAGLLALTEGLYKMECIDEDTYNYFRARYSTPLNTHFKEILEENKEKSLLNDTLLEVAKQWTEHSDPDWRARWLKIASEHPELSNSKLVLECKK